MVDLEPQGKKNDGVEEVKEPSKKRQVKKVLKVSQKNMKTTHNEERTSQHKLDMPLLQYVFSDSVERFYAHKSLSKYYVSSKYIEDNLIIERH